MCYFYMRADDVVVANSDTSFQRKDSYSSAEAETETEAETATEPKTEAVADTEAEAKTDTEPDSACCMLPDIVVGIDIVVCSLLY